MLVAVVAQAVIETPLAQKHLVEVQQLNPFFLLSEESLTP